LRILQQASGDHRMGMMRRFLVTALAPSVLCAAAGAFAQPEVKFPQTVRIVVPFSPGASNDAVARVLAPQLAKRLGTSVIVENRAGAAGVIGADLVAKGP